MFYPFQLDGVNKAAFKCLLKSFCGSHSITDPLFSALVNIWYLFDRSFSFTIQINSLGTWYLSHSLLKGPFVTANPVIVNLKCVNFTKDAGWQVVVRSHVCAGLQNWPFVSTKSCSNVPGSVVLYILLATDLVVSHYKSRALCCLHFQAVSQVRGSKSNIQVKVSEWKKHVACSLKFTHNVTVTSCMNMPLVALHNPSVPHSQPRLGCSIPGM